MVAKWSAGTAGKEPAKRAAPQHAAAKTAAPRKQAAASAAKKSTTPRKASAAEKTATRKTGAKTVAAKKTAAHAAAAESAASTSSTSSAFPAARAAQAVGPVEPGALPVRPEEEPWSADEVEEARAELLAEADRLQAEILASETAISGLMRDSGDGAGDDQADVGTKNISREHEMALANNAREMLRQIQHALERLDVGTYGLCESCGKPIGKARMQAFPRATLCVECKQRQERH